MQDPRGLFSLTVHSINIDLPAQKDQYDDALDSNVLAAANPVQRRNTNGRTLVIALDGYGQSGQIVPLLHQELSEKLKHESVAEFDVDQLIDYRGRRPTISFDQDHFSEYQQPELEMQRFQDLRGQEFFLLAGPEPDYQWERFVSAVQVLVQDFGIDQVVWAHGIPMPVPHTRPLGVSVHGNRSEVNDLGSQWRPMADIPASVSHLLEFRLSDAGVPVSGFGVHVPHYIATSAYPAAAVTAIDYLSAASGLVLPTEELRQRAREVDAQIAEQVEGSDQAQEMISSWEEQFDEYAAQSPHPSLLTGVDGEVPDADQIGAEFEKFLAHQRFEDPEERDQD